MTQVEKTSKLKEIKETLSGAVEIISQIRAPGVQESFGKVIGTAMIAKEIIEALKTPEMVKNIENFCLISENINESATKLQNVLNQIEETGAINEAKGLITSAKSTMDLFGNNIQDLGEMGSAIKGVFKSIRTAQEIIHAVRFNNKSSTSDEIVVSTYEAEEYLKIGWQYLATLPNGKVVVRKGRV